jgi:hypothetical protein
LFPNVGWMQGVSHCNEVILDIYENWVKQSFRSRYEIAGPNGRLNLSVPTIKQSRQRLKDVKISYTDDWITNHLRSVKTAYNRSPYFEFYAQDFETILLKKHVYLLDLSLEGLTWGLDKLQLQNNTKVSEQYALGDVENEALEIQQEGYHQVFEEKNGFIEGLSFIDLLFNCGPEAQAFVR